MKYKDENYRNFTIHFNTFFNEYGDERVVAFIKTKNGTKGVEGKTKRECFEEIKLLIDGVK